MLLIAQDNNQHYVLIRNFSRVLGDRTKHDGTQFFCYRCYYSYIRNDLLQNHTKLCKKTAAQIIEMPSEENNLHFTATHTKHPIAYVIYADFESMLLPIHSASLNSSQSYTQKSTQHVPCGYAYLIVSPDGKTLKNRSVEEYSGENAVEHFLTKIMRKREILGKDLMQIQPMKVTPEEQKRFREATECCICKKALGDYRVRDRDHLTSKYRGGICGLQFKF